MTFVENTSWLTCLICSLTLCSCSPSSCFLEWHWFWVINTKWHSPETPPCPILTKKKKTSSLCIHHWPHTAWLTLSFLLCLCISARPSRLGRVINDFIKLADNYQARGQRRNTVTGRRGAEKHHDNSSRVWQQGGAEGCVQFQSSYWSTKTATSVHEQWINTGIKRRTMFTSLE